MNTIVKDDTGEATFVIFGKIAEQLFQIPAIQLANQPRANRHSLPPVITVIHGTTHIFEVTINNPNDKQIAQQTTKNSFKVERIFKVTLAD